MVSATVQGYLNGPASKPPNGMAVNLINPPHNSTGPLVLLIICTVFTLLATLGRAYSRIFIMKRLRVEDYLGLFAFLSYIVVVYSFLRYWSKVGFFIHMWDLRGADLVEVSYVGFIINIGYSLVLLFSKSAILLEWVHIFVPKGNHNAFWWSSRAMMAANICLYTTALIVVFAGCQPLQLFWNFWLPGHCVDRKARDTANAAFNVVMDIIILLLPQPVIWKLQMTTNRKIGVCIVFSVGLLAIVTALGRLHGIVTMDYPTDLTHTFDTSYQFSIELEWIIAELTCVILVFCVPAIPKIFSGDANYFTNRITGAWRSWTRLRRSSRSSNDDGNYIGGDSPPSWVQIHHDGGSGPESRQRGYGYGVVDEESLIIADINKHGMTALEPVAARYGYSGDSNIVKTVEIDRHIDASGTFAVSQLDLQHPWMNH